MQKSKSLKQIKFPDGFITEDRKSMIGDCIAFAETIPRGMTEYQIKNFVLSNRDYPTVDSKYWQAKLEVIARVESAIEIALQLNKELAELDNELALLPVLTLTKRSKIKKRIQLTNIELLKFKIVLSQVKLKDTLRESEVFYSIVSNLSTKLKFSNINKEDQEESFWKAKAEFNNELDKIMKVGGYVQSVRRTGR